MQPHMLSTLFRMVSESQVCLNIAFKYFEYLQHTRSIKHVIKVALDDKRDFV